MTRRWLALSVMLFVWLFVAGNGWAETLKLTWTLPPDKDLAGLKLYQRDTSGNFIKPVILGPTVTTYTTLNITTPGALLFFLTAYDKAGNESKASNEYRHVFVGTPVVVPPVVLPVEKCMTVASATTKEITIKLVPCVN